eukprot:3788404-Rhodomonas_salina.3
MSGTEIGYGGTRRAGDKKAGPRLPPTCLPPFYAMSGTDMAYGRICLRLCYAMSGTDLAYDGMSRPILLRDVRD